MENLLNYLSKITDVLNVGRLIFYPIAGALVVLPLRMILDLLQTTTGKLPANIWADPIPSNPSIRFLITIFIVSLVAGFLIAIIGFGIVIARLSSQVHPGVLARPLSPYAFPFNYPSLRNNEKEDYAAWLISEYYRYLEIAIFIPLGAVLGLGLLEIYLLVFVLKEFGQSGSAGVTEAQVMLVLILAVLIWIKEYAWVEIWEQRVIKPTFEAFAVAKKFLIDGLKQKPPKS